MVTMLKAVSLFVFIGLALAKHEIYDGHALYEITVKSTDQIELVNYLTVSLNLDVWSHPISGRPGMILAPKEKKELFQNELSAAGVEFKVQTDNIKEHMDFEDAALSKATKRSINGSRLDSLSFDQIYTYDEIDSFLDMLAEAYPQTVTLVNAGKSFLGRDIKYIKISSSNFQDTSKPIIYMQSLLHAREWITLPSTLYAIHRLVIDVTEQDLIQDLDWIILPIANPDGYIHTHEESRLWRKNRNTNNGVCAGVDLNRNYDVHWSTASSNLACSDTFHGTGPFSEPETQITRNILREYGSRIKLFLDIHSFGSMVLYGYGNGVLPSNGLIVHLIGVQMANAIDEVKMSWNPNYIVGNIALVLYDASGGASDYAMVAGIPLSYTYELPGHRFGAGGLGFLVDPDFIEQAGFETWEGIKVAARYVRDTY